MANIVNINFSGFEKWLKVVLLTKAFFPSYFYSVAVVAFPVLFLKVITRQGKDLTALTKNETTSRNVQLCTLQNPGNCWPFPAPLCGKKHGLRGWGCFARRNDNNYTLPGIHFVPWSVVLFLSCFFFLNPSHPPSLFLFHRHWLTGTCLPTKSWQLSWYSKPPIAPECTPHGKDLRRHFRQALELSLPARPWEGSGATMTIIYQYRVATTSLGGFLRLLTIWRGSVYKLMYKEILIFSSMYAAISVTYRVGLNEKQRQ